MYCLTLCFPIKKSGGETKSSRTQSMTPSLRESIKAKNDSLELTDESKKKYSSKNSVISGSRNMSSGLKDGSELMILNALKATAPDIGVLDNSDKIMSSDLEKTIFNRKISQKSLSKKIDFNYESNNGNTEKKESKHANKEKKDSKHKKVPVKKHKDKIKQSDSESNLKLEVPRELDSNLIKNDHEVEPYTIKKNSKPGYKEDGYKDRSKNSLEFTNTEDFESIPTLIASANTKTKLSGERSSRRSHGKRSDDSISNNEKKIFRRTPPPLTPEQKKEKDRRMDEIHNEQAEERRIERERVKKEYPSVLNSQETTPKKKSTSHRRTMREGEDIKKDSSKGNMDRSGNGDKDKTPKKSSRKRHHERREEKRHDDYETTKKRYQDKSRSKNHEGEDMHHDGKGEKNTGAECETEGVSKNIFVSNEVFESEEKHKQKTLDKHGEKKDAERKDNDKRRKHKEHRGHHNHRRTSSGDHTHIRSSSDIKNTPEKKRHRRQESGPEEERQRSRSTPSHTSQPSQPRTLSIKKVIDSDITPERAHQLKESDNTPEKDINITLTPDAAKNSKKRHHHYYSQKTGQKEGTPNELIEQERKQRHKHRHHENKEKERETKRKDRSHHRHEGEEKDGETKEKKHRSHRKPEGESKGRDRHNSGNKNRYLKSHRSKRTAEERANDEPNDIEVEEDHTGYSPFKTSLGLQRWPGSEKVIGARNPGVGFKVVGITLDPSKKIQMTPVKVSDLHLFPSMRSSPQRTRKNSQDDTEEGKDHVFGLPDNALRLMNVQGKLRTKSDLNIKKC